ncbi:alpha/beta hydrolase [Candidatus Woesearchaeota archaeon]|nr:alpha/beta hydrolase [Candidatus Woesearchaeota archaeon]
MKKSVIVLCILIIIPFVFADAVPVVDQCFGKCPEKITSKEFVKMFPILKSQIEFLIVPKSLKPLLGDQKMNVQIQAKDEEFIFGVTIKDGRVIDVVEKGYISPTMAVSLSDRTLTSILTASNPVKVVESALAEGRIVIEGEGFFNTARALGTKAYSLFAIPEHYFELNPFACMNISENERIILRETKFGIKIPKDYDVIIPPFEAKCSKDMSFNTRISVPQNYLDIQVLRCNTSICTPLDVMPVETLSCGEDIIKVYRQEEYFNLSLAPINIPTKKELLNSGDSVSAGRLILTVANTTQPVNIRISSPTKTLKQPKNPSLKILGAPVIVASDQSASARIVLPYISDPSIDPDSVSAYSLIDEAWVYLGGSIDKQTFTFSTNVNLEIDENIFALFGQICVNCKKPALERVYDSLSGTKDAVILVHGLGVSPATYQDIIDDIRQTQQPFQAWTFGYPYKQPIEENAQNLADNLEKNNDEFENIYFVGHSLGGIIIQEALKYAEKNKLSFLNKIRKVILVSVPNNGVVDEGIFNDLLNILVNSKIPGWFDINTQVVQELIKGKLVDRVSGIEYSVIAGIQPYEFTKLLGVKEKNDGIVPVKSAQNVGGIYVNNRCDNYWELDVPHTLIVEHPIARNILEKIVSKEVRKDITDRALLGNQQYFELSMPFCPKESLVIVGKHVASEKAPDKICGCGNGYCGVDEDAISCPTDCATIFRKEFYCSSELKWGLLTAFILLLIITLSVNRYVKNYSARHKSFFTIVSASIILLLLLILINILCTFNMWLFILELLLALIFSRKLWNLWKKPIKMLK